MSADLVLVLDRRELLVRMEGKALRVEHPQGTPQRVPLSLLGMVIVHGAPIVACDVWRALAEHNIPAVLLPARGVGAAACVGAGLSTSIQIRLLQHRGANEASTALDIARALVELKFKMLRALIERLPQAPAEQPGFRTKQELRLRCKEPHAVWKCTNADLIKKGLRRERGWRVKQ